MSADTAAPPEFCAHCGQRLGSVRIILVGSDLKLHPHCQDAFNYRKAARDSWRDADTSNRPRP